jgi:hypothetical protein
VSAHWRGSVSPYCDHGQAVGLANLGVATEAQDVIVPVFIGPVIRFFFECIIYREPTKAYSQA